VRCGISCRWKKNHNHVRPVKDIAEFLYKFTNDYPTEKLAQM
jgi:hypothetical protein